MICLVALAIVSFCAGLRHQSRLASSHQPSITMRGAITALGLAVLIFALLVAVLGAGWMLSLDGTLDAVGQPPFDPGRIFNESAYEPREHWPPMYMQMLFPITADVLFGILRYASNTIKGERNC